MSHTNSTISFTDSSSTIEIIPMYINLYRTKLQEGIPLGRKKGRQPTIANRGDYIYSICCSCMLHL